MGNVYDTSARAQRQRIEAWLREHGSIDTLTARRELDVLIPAARIHELRHRHGLRIDLVWIDRPTDCGKTHRVGKYVLQVGYNPWRSRKSH